LYYIIVRLLSREHRNHIGECADAQEIKEEARELDVRDVNNTCTQLS